MGRPIAGCAPFPFLQMYELILRFAEEDENIRAVILNGSRANPEASLDRLRDYDIVYLVTDVAPYKQGDISGAFGELLVMERTDESELYNEHLPDCAVYLMQFADGNRIDLTVAKREDYHGYCFDDKLSIVLLDKDRVLPLFHRRTAVLTIFISPPCGCSKNAVLNFGGQRPMCLKRCCAASFPMRRIIWKSVPAACCG